jgi:hypothetical protein
MSVCVCMCVYVCVCARVCMCVYVYLTTPDRALVLWIGVASRVLFNVC